MFFPKEKGLILRTLAKQLGVDPGTLTKWEKGECEPHGKIKEKVILY
jgi:transcriptional regulator with XRE-family HTH domain